MVVIARVVDEPGAEQPIIFVNDAFLRRTGYQRAEVIGRSWRMLLGADTDRADVERIAGAVARTESVTAELMYYTKSGAPYWVELELVPFADEGGINTHWVAVGRDITERKKSESHIHRLAFFDVLTGLPNRRLLMDRLDKLLASAQAGAGFGAVMFIDLDHFKNINDARGHAIGDALLRNVAERLSKLVRKGDTVARIGGDEFVVLLAQLGYDSDSAGEAALKVAEKVRHAVTECFEIDGQSYNSSASIGVTLLPKPGQTVHDLLREADTAMYRAKADGRNGVAFFEATMQAEVERRLTLERDLDAALRQRRTGDAPAAAGRLRRHAGRRRAADALAARGRHHGGPGRVHPGRRRIRPDRRTRPVGVAPGLPGLRCDWSRRATPCRCRSTSARRSSASPNLSTRCGRCWPRPARRPSS